MPVIGTFSAVKDGYAGSIRTLMLNGRVRITANDRKDVAGAPDFRISLGVTEIGAAWRKTKKGSSNPTCASGLTIPPGHSRSGVCCWKPPRTASCV